LAAASLPGHHARVPDDWGHPLHANPDYPSYMLGHQLPLLPTARRDLPCTRHPERWDEDQHHNVKQAAARECRQHCPQLDACRTLATQLGQAARGVMGGRIMPMQGEAARRTRRPQNRD
jgi:hypothetical protein